MTTSAGEVFVLELARVARKANRLVRHLQKSDRDDVMAAALAWCWENRRTYSLTTTLDTWFVNAVRDAYKTWRRGERRTAAESMSEIPTGDTVESAVAAQQAANALAIALPPEYRQVARYEMEGYTRAEMKEAGLSHDVISEARARIKQLRRLLPDDYGFRRALRSAPSRDSAERPQEMSNIDHEIEALDFPPPSGQECPPCWRCLWFEGWLPGAHKSVRMPIVEPEIAKAVADTEARKVTIARGVRDGNLQYVYR